MTINELAAPLLPSRRLVWVSHLATGAMGLLLAAWFLVVSVWGLLHGWIVPRIDEYRPRMEVLATQALGLPVRIGSVSAYSNGWLPAFELRDVVLQDKAGQPALQLPRVLAALSPRSLWHLGFEQLYVEGLVLDVRRDRQGNLFVAGLDALHADNESSGAADWFFAQKEIVVRHGTLRWTDEQRHVPPLTLDDVDVVVRNQLRRHALRIDATPPAAWGSRFTATARFRQPLLSLGRDTWKNWVGLAYAQFDRVDVSELRRYAEPGIDIAQGNGSLRLWADLDRGQLMGTTADVALAEVKATLGQGLEPLDLQSIRGRLAAKRVQSGFEFSTQNLQFHTREGLRWPGGNVFVARTEQDAARPAKVELRADRLDLEALAQIARHLPLGKEVHANLAQFAPRGLVERMSAKWQGRDGALAQYEANGRVVHLDVGADPTATAPGANAATPSWPGVSNATLDFALTQLGGNAVLRVDKGALYFPGVFEEPRIPVDELAANLAWQVNGEKIAVQVNQLQFSNADAQGSAQARWNTGPASRPFPGVLELSGRLARGKGQRAYRYLPSVLPAAARSYVKDSVVKATVESARFTVKGPLADFPFSDPRQGEFRVEARVKDAEYVFAPPSVVPGSRWPVFTGLSGDLVFDRRSLEVREAKGSVLGAAAVQIHAPLTRVADLEHAVVQVDGTVKGSGADVLATINGSSVGVLLGHALSEATVQGPLDGRLQLSLPLSNLNNSTVVGQVNFNGTDLRITPASPLLGRIRGALRFTESGFTFSGAQARILGGDARLDGNLKIAPVSGPSSKASPVLAIRAQGAFSADGLRQARELGLIARLADAMAGTSSYQANFGWRLGRPELSIQSNLQGLEVKLPAPFTKAAEATLPLRYDNTVNTASVLGGVAMADQIQLELGGVASALFVRDLSAAQPHVVRGRMGVGLGPSEVVRIPESGVAASVRTAVLDIDAWQHRLAPLTTSAGAADDHLTQDYLPTNFSLRTPELRQGGRVLHQVAVGGTRDAQLWRATVEASELAGTVEYRQSQARQPAKLYARLARLNLPPSAAKDVDALLAETDLPSLDIVIDDLELKGKRLGKAEVTALNQPSADGRRREWHLQRLALTVPEASLSATGVWAVLPGPRETGSQTQLKLKLDVGDAGDLLARFGMVGVVRRGKGAIEGQLSWDGSPLGLDYASLRGQLKVDIENGQFLKVEPGLAKLLGVLSLQSLPRRLTLDFRDVFSEGFAFDFVRGDALIERGVAQTSNLQMKGVSAAVLMDGRADVVRETQDLRVLVVPEINAGTASLVASVLNPAIGLSTFLAQLVLRRPLIQANTREFHIQGSWSDPQVKEVPHVAAPEGAAPATGGKP